MQKKEVKEQGKKRHETYRKEKVNGYILLAISMYTLDRYKCLC